MPLARKPNTNSLPPNNYPPGDLHTAYEHCLRLERQLRRVSSEAIMGQDMTPRIVARVLGWGLYLAPNNAGQGALVRDIIACDQDQELLAGLAHLYVYGLIRVCTCSYHSPLLLLLIYFQSSTPRVLHLP